MAKFLILLAATAAVCSAAGPTQPDSRGRCDEELNKVVDQNNMCWYHECVNNDGYLEFLPRRCAGGSKISYNFVQGPENPCTVNFDSVIGYDCVRDRPSVDGPPPCHDSSVRLQCQNGGVAVYEADKCWCDCPPSWQGDELCRLPTKPVTDLPAGSNICVDGEPMQDWCKLDYEGGCKNNGICYNQCDTFWCDCPRPKDYDYYGKRCELR